MEGQRRQHPGCTPAWLGPSWGAISGSRSLSPTPSSSSSPGLFPFSTGPAGEPGRVTAEPVERPSPALVHGSSSSAKVSLTVSKEPRAPGTHQIQTGREGGFGVCGKETWNRDIQLSSDCFPKQRAPGPVDPACGRRRGHRGRPLKASNRQDEVRVGAPAQQAGAQQQTKRPGASTGDARAGGYLVRMLRGRARPAPGRCSFRGIRHGAESRDHLQTAGQRQERSWQGDQTRRRKCGEGAGAGWQGRFQRQGGGGRARGRGMTETGW